MRLPHSYQLVVEHFGKITIAPVNTTSDYQSDIRFYLLSVWIRIAYETVPNQ